MTPRHVFGCVVDLANVGSITRTNLSRRNLHEILHDASLREALQGSREPVGGTVGELIHLHS